MKRSDAFSLHVVPKTPELYGHYMSWFQSRGAALPPPSDDMILIADPRGALCGVSLYPTTGPYVFAEHMATNPMAPLRLRHRAVAALLRALRAYCAMRAKYPLVVIRHRALVRMLVREGFTHQPAVVMSADPVMRIE